MRLLWSNGFFFVFLMAFLGCERHLELALKKESVRPSATATQTDTSDDTSTSSETDSNTHDTATNDTDSGGLSH
jgi:hypothetical protein